MPFCAKAPTTVFISLKAAAAPRGRRTKRAAAALPLTGDSNAHPAEASTASVRLMFALAIHYARWHGDCIKQFSPKQVLCRILSLLLKLFMINTLNLLKQNLFIRELGWRSEIIIIGGYLQQEDEKEWYSLVISGMYFIASQQNTADREKNWHFRASVYCMLQCNQYVYFPTVKIIFVFFFFNIQKWRGRRTAWEPQPEVSSHKILRQPRSLPVWN